MRIGPSGPRCPQPTAYLSGSWASELGSGPTSKGGKLCPGLPEQRVKGDLVAMTCHALDKIQVRTQEKRLRTAQTGIEWGTPWHTGRDPLK